MANEQLKADARAGQPKALEALMNQALGNQGITVRVIKSGDLLKITLRSNSLPDQKIADLVKKGIASINPDGVTKVELRGEQVKGKNSWTTEWDLSNPKTTSAPCLAIKSKSKWYFHPAVIVGGATAAFILLISTSTLVDPPAQPPPAPSPTVTPSPAAAAPTPTPTPTTTPQPPQWQPPQGWALYVTDQGQRLAIRQRENPSCGERLYCADFEVMPSVTCRNGVYMEIQWIDSNTKAVEDWGNDFLPRLEAGQVGRLSTGIDWPPESFTATFNCN